MGVWRVPDDRIRDVGTRMARCAASRTATSGPTYADWPYSVFTMAHGRSKEECDAILDSIADEHELHGDDRATLYSSTEFKKIRLHYFTDDYADWEREHAGFAPERASRLDTPHIRGLCTRERWGLLPGGVNSPVRAMRSIGREHPLFVDRGEGFELVDADGNRYVDWVCSWGPADPRPRVTRPWSRRCARRRRRGRATARRPRARSSWRRRSWIGSPSVEMVRMTSSGTEAAMSAMRLARAATGREKVLKFAGAYHGHVDGLLAEAGSGLASRRLPASPGVTAAQAADTIVVRWNDRDAVERGPRRHTETELAAILAEPLPANMGVVEPERGFLDFLRAAASEHGALLVLDEVISGFRVARGGAPGALRRRGGPDRPRQGPRRRPARRGVRRPAAS